MEYGKITRDQILALDMATVCGYHSTHASGEWNFTVPVKGYGKKQHVAFRDTLRDFITTYGIRKIVAEDVTVCRTPSQIKTSVKLGEFRGIMLEVIEELGLLPPTFINLSTVKKFATGRGDADKEAMIKACRERWGIDPVSDNEADATHIFMCYVRLFDID